MHSQKKELRYGFADEKDSNFVVKNAPGISLKFYSMSYPLQKFNRTNGHFLVSSYVNEPVNVYKPDGTLIKSLTTSGPVIERVDDIYDPAFYHDQKYIYWGRYTDFHILKIDPGNNFSCEDIISFEKLYLPESKPPFKLFRFNSDIILVYIPRSSTVSYTDPYDIAFLYRYNEQDSTNLLYNCRSEKPVLSKLNIPRFPHLDCGIYDDKLLVWDAYNLKMSFYNSNYEPVRQYDFTKEELNVVPYRCCSNQTPLTNRVRLLIDDVSGKMFFVIKNESREERLVQVGLGNDLTVTGIHEIALLPDSFYDFEIQQVYNNKIYHILKINDNSYICEQEMERTEH